MRLKEYIGHLSHVVHHFNTQGDTMEAIAQGKGATPGQQKSTYDRAIEEVHDSLIRNKKLLGVYDQPIQTEEDREKAKEREIKPHDLKRHIIKSRHELRHFKSKRTIDTSIGDDNAIIEGYKLQAESVEEIVVQILTQLSEALGINAGEVGTVFSEGEKEIHNALFERPQISTPSPTDRFTQIPLHTYTVSSSTIFPPAPPGAKAKDLLSKPPVPLAPLLPDIKRAPPPIIPELPRKKRARLKNAKPQSPDKLAEQTEKAMAARRAAAEQQLAAMSDAERAAHFKSVQDAASVKDEVALKIKLLEQELRDRKIIQ